jgi:hypothetical protein
MSFSPVHSLLRSANIDRQRLCRKPAGLAGRLAPIALAGVTLSFAANPAQALTLFTGVYAPPNWTQSVQPDGSINAFTAPTSISLTSADDGGTEPGVNKNTDFTIAAPLAGTASFSWSYVTADTTGPQLDPFGYLLNGNFMQLSLNDGPNFQSGSTSFSVIVGDIFGFRLNSFDSLAGRATTTITNFNGPVPSGSASVPGPLPLLGLSVAFGYSSRLRKRMAARGGLNSAAGRES